jgi:RND superfamily putative drug exporter
MDSRSPRNLAHRMGRWSGLHPWRAILGWVAFVAICFAAGNAVGTTKVDENTSGPGQSGHAARILDQAGFNDQPASELVFVQAQRGNLSDPTLRSVDRDVRARLGALPDVANIHAPERSRDGRSAKIEFEIRGAPADAPAKVGPILVRVAAIAAAHRGVRVEQFGDASAGKALDDKLSSDFSKAERLSIPITLLILIVAFGALLAAGIPVLLGLTSVFSAIGLAAVASSAIPTSQSAPILMMLIGMAVGVDYSLFYLKREREERARGLGRQAALEAAAATSGHAVLVSGITVMASLAGLYFMGDADSAAMATGSILVVGVAVLGSLTVLPAVLAKLGDRVHRSRLPLLRRLKREERDSRAWGFLLGHVLRRPVVALVAGVGVLVALAIPALGMHTKVTGIADLPRSSFPVLKTYDRISAAFPAVEANGYAVVQAKDAGSPQVKAAIADLQRRALAAGAITAPTSTELSKDHTVALVQLPLAGDGTGSTSQHAVTTLRRSIVPAAFGGIGGASVAIGGRTAETMDSNATLAAHAPLVFIAVLTMAFVLLLVTFRSIVIPIKAILLNLLSVAAAYGVLTMVFQHGLGTAIGLPQTDGIVNWLPMFLFVILFGLSMDYHVFILSRIREGWDRGIGNDAAVEQGIRGSAGVVTAAAVVMVAVFSIFATLSLIDLQQFGVGLAAAVLIDATLIRGVVLPAAMKLLGRWNWYMPRSLHRLPALGEAPASAARA